MPADPEPARLHVTGVILAGGKARRMQGKDKGLLPYRNAPLIECVISRLRPQVDDLLINSNRNPDEYARFGFPLVSDIHEGYLGPLAGICGALHCAAPGLLVCVPCDSPQLHPELVARLAEAFSDPDVEIAVATSEGRMQPVFAAFRTELFDSLDSFLREGGRKVDQFYARHVCREISFDRPECFRNINTPEELESP